MGVTGYSADTMGVISRSGFYLSRKVVVFTLVLLGALLLGVAALSSLYVRCTQASPVPSEKSNTLTRASLPFNLVPNKPLAEEKKKEVETSTTLTPDTQPSATLPSWFWDHPSLSTLGPQDHPSLSTPEPWDHPGLFASEPLDHSHLSASEPQLPLTSEPWKHPRLPSDVVPLHYDLELWIYLRPDQIQQTAKTFGGRLSITVQCVSPTARVLLHSLSLDYEGSRVLGPLPEGPEADSEQQPVGQVEVNNFWKFPEMEYVVMELNETLKPDRHYVLQFDYSGLVNQNRREGLFSNFYSDQGKKKALIASQLEPTAARAIFPGFDEPAMKATFNITIVHHPAYVALSNMPVLGTSEREDANGNKWIVTNFETTPPMSTYITAFAVCDYDYVNATERGKEVRIWARKDAIANGEANFALTIAGPVFSKLEDLFNVSYPLPKMDLIGFPILDLQAMENWGLITFDDLMLVEAKNDHPERKLMILTTVTHEVAHQWFGNLVTTKWWNDIWLNEGFATYFEYHTAKHFNPRISKFQNEFFYHYHMRIVFNEDHAMMYRTISSEVRNYTKTSEISGLFDKYIYQKGGCIIRMLSNFLSENLFISGLKTYLKTFAFSNAEQDDLWNHLQMALDNQTEVLLPASVKTIMDKWTHQAGYPVITLDMSTGRVNQEPFLLAYDKTQTSFIHNNTWNVPIVWMKNGIVQPLVWLDNSSQVFPEMQLSDPEHDWVLLNLNATGYYMVNYGQLGWKKISSMLQKDPKAIPTADRMKLFDDAFALAQQNYIDIGSALGLTKYLAKEEEAIVWNTVLTTLLQRQYFVNMNNHNIYSLFKKYFLKRLTPMWHIYSAKIRENALQDDELAILSLRNVYKAACWLELEDCLQLSREIFSKWMSDVESIKNFTLVANEVMCSGVAQGSEKEWDFLMNIYEKTALDGENNGIMESLSCSKHPRILYRYMEYALNDKLFSSEAPNIFKSVAETEIGRLVAKDFLIDNWQAVKERFGSPHLLILAESIARTTSTDSQVQELHRFFDNMLEEKERIKFNEYLQDKMDENLQNSKTVAQLAEWLKENMAD
ncbi:aminopeptidase Q [Dromiciops gliroides]|uniref:aminopeptidase Q n=1 Tax=Dromiciops gliroides TaxID=33562 RepID=UPI001CC5F576|nr:aminopeptidase Q [Dromiciops gliroides]